jgi:predicted amidophosphoribosyltransferase
VMAAPTALLWHRDRRLSKPGLCKQCGYDIRGLQTCPECGATLGGESSRK